MAKKKCGAKREGLTCDLPNGHPGPYHVSSDTGWPDDGLDAPPPLEPVELGTDPSDKSM